jgi:thiosulfate/3-mercaptopyruvate sulfurtransferase
MVAKKWELEKREYTKDKPASERYNYKANPPDQGVREYMPHVRGALEKIQEDSTTVPVAARSPKEFTGEITALPEYPTDHAQCGGHIPGAKNIPWA